MTYFEDLSPYSYMPNRKKPYFLPEVLNVGWLDGTQGYSQGDVPASFAEKLWAYCRVRVAGTRGMHTCEICPEGTFGFRARRGEEELWLGSAEIRVFGTGGIVYAAPNMIYHYVVDHRYRPPEEFVQAVLESNPSPGSLEYETAVRRYDPC